MIEELCIFYILRILSALCVVSWEEIIHFIKRVQTKNIIYGILNTEKQ